MKLLIVKRHTNMKKILLCFYISHDKDITLTLVEAIIYKQHVNF